MPDRSAELRALEKERASLLKKIEFRRQRQEDDALAIEQARADLDTVTIRWAELTGEDETDPWSAT